MLLDVRRSIGNLSLTLWKSDIADAYRLLPMSPYWQLKQIVTVDGERHVDRNLTFGTSSSPGIFISFNSLMAWIAKNVKSLRFILNYVDDLSECSLSDDISFYTPYERNMPTDQFRLLSLWDELGIPHKPTKQLSGCPLTIIGIDVDANKMTLTLPDSAKERLTAELRFWCAKPPKNSSGSFKLKLWQRLAGWFNWALNVYPLLRPALNNLYAKIAGKQQKDQRIYINNAIRDDLKWALTHLELSEGVHLFKSFSWSPSIADFVIYCDACPEGLGFWYPHSKEAYYGPTPGSVPTNAIFYFESLAVLSALVNVQRKAARGSKILIYTDNLNTINMFRFLRCLPPYNRILKRAANILLQHNYSLRVLHVPGEQNTVADALSRVQFSVAFKLVPDLYFTTFNPPYAAGSAA